MTTLSRGPPCEPDSDSQGFLTAFGYTGRRAQFIARLGGGFHTRPPSLKVKSMSREHTNTSANPSIEVDCKIEAQVERSSKLYLLDPGDTGDLLADEVQFAFVAAYTDGFPMIVLVTTKGLRHAPASIENRGR